MTNRECSNCGEWKDVSEFTFRDRNAERRMGTCRSCKSSYNKRHYEKNKKKYVEKSRRWWEAARRERVGYLIGFLRAHPCVDCGESDVVVLDFDHLNDKTFDISTGIRHHSWKSVLAEIDKCEVVCVNCHKRRTARRKGSVRYLLTRAGERDRTVITSLEG